MNTFNVVRRVNAVVFTASEKQTFHWCEERASRAEFFSKHTKSTRVLASFEVDRNHINGLEIHSITEDAIIIVQNKQSQRIVTQFAARAPQIMRYFNGTQMPIEFVEVIRKAREHERNGWNYM